MICYEMNEVFIPPDPDGTGAYLTQIQGTGFNYAVVNTNSQTVNYNLFTEVATTNDLGNYYQVLEGMNDSLGGYYRYESGTSMAAADVSGTLALIQDFFTNTLQMTPSPALLKAMLINGARPTLPYYNMQVGNPINNEGWGLINLPNSLPTNAAATFIASGSTPASMFIQDQSPTNALATGDSHTFTLTISVQRACGAAAPDAGLDGPARRSRRRHQARQRPRTGRDEPRQPDESRRLLRQRHSGATASTRRKTRRTS